MRSLSAVELYQELEKYFSVAASYKVGFAENQISAPVLEVIKHLKGNLNPEDIIPSPTSLTLVLKDKATNLKIIDTFHQSSSVYMEKFDDKSFQEFCESNLIDKLADVPHSTTEYHKQTQTHLPNL